VADRSSRSADLAGAVPRPAAAGNTTLAAWGDRRRRFGRPTRSRSRTKPARPTWPRPRTAACRRPGVRAAEAVFPW